MWVQFVLRAAQTHVPVLNLSSEIYFNFTWLSWTLCLTGQEPWRCCVIFKTSIWSFQLLINRLQPPTYPSFYQRMLLLQISAINCPIKCWKILKCKRYLPGHDDDWPGTVQMLILPLFSPRVHPAVLCQFPPLSLQIHLHLAATTANILAAYGETHLTMV